MKRFSGLYYLLFFLLIMGAFASMAQNDYGNTILGLVAVAFGLIFLTQLIDTYLSHERTATTTRLELISLVVMAGLISLRVFYIHFLFVEAIFGLAGTVLILVYSIRLVETFTRLLKANRFLAWATAAFHLSIILFTAAMTVVPLFPKLVEPAGGLAFALILVFGFMQLISRNNMIEGEKISPLGYFRKGNDNSILLASIFIAFSLYMGLTKVDLLPKVYSDEFPQAYFYLVNEAESGREKLVKGKYRHEAFKDAYENFVQRNGDIGTK